MQFLVDPTASVAACVSIGPGSVICAGAKIGEGCQIGPMVFIDEGVEIGPNCRLDPQVVVLRGSKIGRGCHLSSGCVIGTQGFGFVEHEGTHHHIPQIGGVEIGEDTVIGANSCVDRGTMKPTRIGDRCRIGVQVQLAHNTQVGDDTVFEDQSGLAGSVTVGKNCRIGAQAGLAGASTMGDNSSVGARAGVTRKVPSNTEMWGFPARPKAEAMRNVAALSLLAKMFAKEGKLPNPEA